ncbi:hypothetical protein [Acidisoma silvae]|uniref:Uncharacterized protein n=1 Tax=Acidisoma silvae TaxID=2802396 RepID=A0A963YVX9_9PROT|nr:hypothetical protein [Acidisoma silvae]MCB8877133.1 hypothetical protein [Acidisoma silvae]
MATIQDTAINLDMGANAPAVIGFEIETFLAARPNILAQDYTVLRQPADASRLQPPFWANRVEFAWTTEAGHLPCLVEMLDNLTLKNCATIGGVILIHAGSFPSSPPPLLLMARHACFYYLAPTVSVLLEGATVGLAVPPIWNLHRISLQTWSELQRGSVQRLPAVLFSEGPLIQAVM